MHWPGIEPGPPAWQARILPLNHQCSSNCITDLNGSHLRQTHPTIGSFFYIPDLLYLIFHHINYNGRIQTFRTHEALHFKFVNTDKNAKQT